MSQYDIQINLLPHNPDSNNTLPANIFLRILESALADSQYQLDELNSINIISIFNDADNSGRALEDIFAGHINTIFDLKEQIHHMQTLQANIINKLGTDTNIDYHTPAVDLSLDHDTSE